MKNMKVSVKITLGFGVVLLLTLVLVISVLVTNTMSNNALANARTLHSFELNASEFETAFNMARIASAVMMFDMSAEEYNHAVLGYNDASAQLTAMRGTAAQTPLLAAYVNELNRLLNDLSLWRQHIENIGNANLRVDELRGDFIYLEYAAITAAAHVVAMQLQNLENDVQNETRTRADLLRRHSRLDNAVQISDTLNLLAADIAQAFGTMDLSALSAIRADALTLHVAINRYVDGSTQPHDVHAGEAVRTAFVGIMAGLDEFAALVEQREDAILTTRAHAAALLTAVNATLASVTASLVEAMAEAEEAGGVALVMAFIMGLLSLALGAIVAIAIVRSISKPIGRLVKIVNEVSAGRLHVNIDRADIAGDEVGILTRDVSNLVDIIRSIVEDLTVVQQIYNVQGNSKYRIDADKYQNAFKDMITSINTIFNEEYENVMSTVDSLNHISDGDFDIQVRELPGDWKVQTTAFHRLITNLKAVNAEVNAMIDAAANKGDLSYKIDGTKYAGGWREIMDGLNRIAIAVNTPLTVIRMSMDEMGAGNFDLASIDGKVAAAGFSADPTSYRGVFGDIVSTFDAVIAATASYINEIEATLAQISDGNLRVAIARDYVGSYDSIKRSVNSIASTLHKTMTEISTASEQVLSGAKQISTSASNLANGAQEQASSVQELNASIDIISHQTRQNADNALEANTLSNKSAQNARAGNDAMKLMLDSMEKIKESGTNISRINKVIQEIAFQTNLLALNASVEAARAGEHGRGFAVVAEEVRTLAVRSQKSVTETTEFISDSLERVGVGNSVAATTAEELKKIVDNANDMLQIINNISVSSREQAEAIGQVSMGLGQISSVVQSNSAVSEEAAAAAQELNAQAEILQQLVAYFKL